jgi:hypothetical protein
VAYVNDRRRNRVGHRLAGFEQDLAVHEPLAVDFDVVLRCIDSLTDDVVVLEVRAVVAEGLETGALQSFDDVIRRSVESGREGVAAFQGVGRQVVQIALQLRRGNTISGRTHIRRERLLCGGGACRCKQQDEGTGLFHNYIRERGLRGRGRL